MGRLEEATVVYVEDEPAIRDKIARVLHRRVKEIHLASNGMEGLELVRRTDPHIVITDLEMPLMNGMEMIRRIREEIAKDKPIIVVTAYQDDEHYTNLADGYIYKPVIIQDLIDLMEKLVERL